MPTISAISSGAGSVCVAVVITSLLVPAPVWTGVSAGPAATRLPEVLVAALAAVRSPAWRSGAAFVVLGMRHLLPGARVWETHRWVALDSAGTVRRGQ